jgi:hypothetical protein
MDSWWISTATEVFAGGDLEPYSVGQVTQFGVELYSSGDNQLSVVKTANRTRRAQHVDKNIYSVVGNVVYVGTREYTGGQIILIDIGIMATIYPTEDGYLERSATKQSILSGTCSLAIDRAHFGPLLTSGYTSYTWRIDNIIRCIGPYIPDDGGKNYVVDQSSMVTYNIDRTDAPVPENIQMIGIVPAIGHNDVPFYRPSHAIDHLLRCIRLR